MMLPEIALKANRDRRYDFVCFLIITAFQDGPAVRIQPLHSVEGTSAEYRVADDDLYIRAIVTSDQDPQIKINFYPQKQTAWTQPFVRKA